jgi:CBS domain containing-hemolysin-like protein
MPWSGAQWTGTGQAGENPGDAAMALLLAAAVVLAVAAGLCASAEIALFRMVRAGGRERARDGSNGNSSAVQAILAEPRRYLSVLLAIRMGAETAAVVLATAALVKLLGTGWHTFLIAFAGMAALLYLLAGIWPVALGRHYDRQLAGAAAGLLVPTVRALGPLPRLLLAVGNALTPGGRAGREAPAESEEELRGLVDLLGERRVIEPGEREMIHSVFEFGDTIVREVMVPRTDIVFAERDKNVRQVLSLALRSGFSRIPVVGENKDDVIGIAYLKDLVARSREHPEAETVEKVESVMRPATFVPESKPVSVLLQEMQARQIHLAIVIDEYGGTAGLVTIEDILEEIVGEITDEYDQERPMVEWLEPDRARVTARLPVTDLEELFGVSIEAEDVETVGGLLAHALGRVPIAGSTATVAGLRLTAESLAGRRNRIGTVTVERTARSRPAMPPVRPDRDSGSAGQPSTES